MATISRVKEEPLAKENQSIRHRNTTMFYASEKTISPPHDKTKSQQRPPQPSPTSADDDAMSIYSDSDEDDINPFGYPQCPSNRNTNVACGWCQNITGDMNAHTLTSRDRLETIGFCGKSCQEAYKANHMKQKLCELCMKQMPAAVTMVTVETSPNCMPLQFCSERCTTRYKMKLFCTEVKDQLKKIAEENIQLPHITTSSGERKILITPELWCQADENAMVTHKEPQAHPESTPYQIEESRDRKRKSCSMESVINKINSWTHSTSEPLSLVKEKTTPNIKPSHDADMTSNPIRYSLRDPNMCSPNQRTSEISSFMEKQLKQADPLQPMACHLPQPPPQHLLPNQLSQARHSQPGHLPHQSASPKPTPMFLPFPVLLPVPFPLPISITTTSKNRTAPLQSGRQKQQGNNEAAKITSNTASKNSIIRGYIPDDPE